MNRREFIKTGILASVSLSINPVLLSGNDDIENEIVNSIHKHINDIHKKYPMSFDEYKVPFVFNYYLPMDKFNKYKFTSIDINRSICTKYHYDFLLLFGCLPYNKYNTIIVNEKRVAIELPGIDYKYFYRFTSRTLPNGETTFCGYVMNDTDHVFLWRDEYWKNRKGCSYV